jgi:phosphoribosylformylglycinamidine cyclo-ligase
LDYFAVGQLEADVAEQVVRGLSIACKENGVALIGGETAEMPGMYRAGEFDLAGFIVGIADRKEMARASRVKAGDVLIGLPSSGLQTNGYSLARKLMFEVAGYAPVQQVPELGTTAGEELLKIHRSFLKPIRLLHEAKLLRGAAHITGGGITDNTPRMLPDGTVARVRLGSWPVLPVFELLRDIGHVADQEMLRTFNMGVGMIMAVSKSSQSKALKLLAREGEEAYVVGDVARARSASSKPKVVYEK